MIQHISSARKKLDRDHSKILMAGFVLGEVDVGWEKENKHIIEYSLRIRFY